MDVSCVCVYSAVHNILCRRNGDGMHLHKVQHGNQCHDRYGAAGAIGVAGNAYRCIGEAIHCELQQCGKLADVWKCKNGDVCIYPVRNGTVFSDEGNISVLVWEESGTCGRMISAPTNVFA